VPPRQALAPGAGLLRGFATEAGFDGAGRVDLTFRKAG